MYHKLKGKIPKLHKLSWGKPKFSLRSTLAGLVLFSIIGVSIYMMFQIADSSKMVDIELPKIYNEAMVIDTSHYNFSIKPLAAQAAKAERSNIFKKADKNKKIYRDAYKNTDVEQIVETKRIKENIIFKQPGHPLEFKYDLGDTSRYLIEKHEGLNEYYFYDKEKVAQLDKEDSNYEHKKKLYKIFTIPEPFVTDANDNKSYPAVQMNIEDNILIINVSEEWVTSHQYPIILDPTIEINVLTLHSIAIVGEEWNVDFTTQGTADLSITLVTDEEYTTNWGEWPEDNASTTDHLKFIELYGDGNSVEHEKILDADGHIIEIRVADWNYSEGKLVNQWLISAKHAIQFDFGGEIAYAYNASDPTFGSIYNFNSETYTHDVHASGLSDTAYLIVWNENGGYGNARVATVSGTVVSFGAEATFNSANTGYTNVATLSSTKAVVCFTDSGDSSHGKCVVATISGTSVSFGSEYEFSANNTGYPRPTALDSTKFVIVFQDRGDSSYGKARVGTISGTTISYGTVSTFNSAEAMYATPDTLDSTHIIVTYNDGGYPGTGNSVVGVISGTSFSSWGSEVTFNASIKDSRPTILSSSKFVVTYRLDAGNGRVRVGNVSGSTITYDGSEYEYDSVQALNLGIDALDSTTFVMSAESFAGGVRGAAWSGTVSGNAITLSNKVTFKGGNSYGTSVVKLTDKKFAIAYKDGSSSGHGDTIIGIVLLANGEACAYGDECVSDYCVNAVCRANCTGYSGYGCSTTGTAYNNAAAGTCVSSSCQTTNPVAMDCGVTCTVGTDTTYSSCSGRGSDSCDSDAGGNFAQNGMCYANAGANGCSTSGYIFYDGTYYDTSSNIATTDYDYDSDNDGKGCDSAITSGADYANNGMVTASGCTTSGVIYLAATTNYYTPSCTTAGNKCDSDPDEISATAPWTADGVCITGGTTCDINEVCFDDSTYQSDCSGCQFVNTDIDACDNGVIGSGGYVADGYCTTGGTCSTGIVYDNAGTLTDGCGTAGQACDSDATGAESGAFSTAANGACIIGNACDTDEVCYDDANYQADCSSCSSSNADIDACHSNVTSGGYVADGYCTTGGTCSTGVVYDNAGTLTNLCSNGGGQACDADATGAESGAFSTAYNGICVDGSACDGNNVASSTNSYYSCNASSDGDQCDTDTSDGAFGQDSMCLSEANDGGSDYTCKDSGHACFDDTYYEDTCASCGATKGCTSALTGSGNFSATGICLTDNSCDESGMVCYDSGDSQYKLTCSSCGITTAEANRCDTDITGGAYSADGTCTDSDTCTTGALYDDEGTLKAGCSVGTTSNVDPCESDASDGWVATGMCLGDSSCGTGIVYTNSGTLTTGCSNGGGEACYTDATNDGSITSWSPTGVCTSGGACTVSALTVLDGGTYYNTCTGHTGASCDSGGGASYTQDGVCLSSGACDISNPVVMDCGATGTSACQVAIDATYNTCDDRYGDACDSTVTGGDFTQNGMCYDSGTYGCLTSGFIFYVDATNYASSTNIATTNYDHDSDADGKGCDSVIISGGDFSVDGMLTSAPACTTSGTVYLAADTNYFTTSCSDGGGQSCDSSITAHLTAPWTADGLCVNGSTCDGTDVASTTTAFYSCDSNSDGSQCDTATSGSFSQDSMCLSETNDGGGGYVCKEAGGHACYDGTYYEDTCASCSVSNGCTSALTGDGDFSAAGICLSDNSCDETTEAAKDCSYAEDDCAIYYSSCASVNDNDRCDTDITDGSFSDIGICSSNSCVATTAENTGAGNCGDGLDNDGDGLVDLYDSGCNTVPSVPVLVSPANGATITDNSPTLYANYSDAELAGWVEYRVTSADTCIAGSNIVSSGISDKTIFPTGTTSWTSPTSVGVSGTYYWCTRNYDGYLSSDWTAMGNFILSNPTTDAFQQGTTFEPGGGGLQLWGITVW